jgi:glucuronokinase
MPPLWLSYLSDPSDSGKIHNDVKQRWLAGDQQVQEGMAQFASFTEEAKVAIQSKDWEALGILMNKNFQLRRDIYGDECLGTDNLRMKSIADSFDCPAKFPGSGGAMVGMCLHGDAKMKELKHAMETEGFVFTKILPNIQAPN